MLVLPELTEQREEHVHAFDLRFVVRQFVHGDVEHRANDSGVVAGVHVDLGSWELHVFQC